MARHPPSPPRRPRAASGAANRAAPASGGAQAPPPDYDVTQQIGHLLRRAYQRHVALFQEEIPDTQLTLAQFVALCAVRDLGGCSLNDLVKRTAIDQATIRGIVDRLLTRGLVKASEDKSDARKRFITLSGEGASLLDAMVPFAQSVSEQTYGKLNPGERVALHFLLGKMCGIE